MLFGLFFCLISIKPHLPAVSSFLIKPRYKQSILNFRKAPLSKYLFTSESTLSFHTYHWLRLRITDVNVILSHPRREWEMWMSAPVMWGQNCSSCLTLTFSIYAVTHSHLVVPFIRCNWYCVNVVPSKHTGSPWMLYRHLIMIRKNKDETDKLPVPKRHVYLTATVGC